MSACVLRGVARALLSTDRRDYEPTQCPALICSGFFRLRRDASLRRIVVGNAQERTVRLVKRGCSANIALLGQCSIRLGLGLQVGHLGLPVRLRELSGNLLRLRLLLLVFLPSDRGS